MYACDNFFKVVVLHYNFVTQQRLTVIIKLGSSARGTRVHWVKIGP